MPATWRGARLYALEGSAPVYATSAAAAADVAQRLREVSARFRADTGREPAPLVAVANDAGDAPVFATLDELASFARASAELLGDERLARAFGADGLRAIRADAAELGLAPERLMAAAPLAGASAALFEVPLGSAAPARVAILPTEARCAELAAELVALAVAREDPGLGRRALMAPVLPFARRRARARALDQSRAFLYELYAAAAVSAGAPRDELARAASLYRVALGLFEP